MAVNRRVPATLGILGFFRSEVVDVNGLALIYGAPGHGVPVNLQPFEGMRCRGNWSVDGQMMKPIRFQAKDNGIVCLAKTRGVFAHHVQHRLQLCRRA